jgi:hypothetical protein
VSTDADAPTVTVEEVAAGVTYPLRGAVLRPGRPVEIPGDDDPSTFHLVARTSEGQVVGGDLVWCDARAAAAGFYERMGFRVVTAPYEISPIGPHLGMLVELTGAAAAS